MTSPTLLEQFSTTVPKQKDDVLHYLLMRGGLPILFTHIISLKPKFPKERPLEPGLQWEEVVHGFGGRVQYLTLTLVRYDIESGEAEVWTNNPRLKSRFVISIESLTGKEGKPLSSVHIQHHTRQKGALLQWALKWLFTLLVRRARKAKNQMARQ